MFTLDQIKTCHAKVKSGADFPAYIREIKQLGVTGYSTYVQDGHTVFSGQDDHTVHSGPRYTPLHIAGTSDAPKFRADLKTHQQGGSSFPAFCEQAADAGIEKWCVSMDAMTCTYYDKAGNVVLTERIPVA